MQLHQLIRNEWKTESVENAIRFERAPVIRSFAFFSLSSSPVWRITMWTDLNQVNRMIHVPFFFLSEKTTSFFFLPLLHEKDVELKFFPLFFIFFLFLLIRDKKKMAPTFLWYSLVADGASMTPLFALKFRIIFFRNAPHSRSRVPIVYVLLGTDSMRMKY